MPTLVHSIIHLVLVNVYLLRHGVVSESTNASASDMCMLGWTVPKGDILIKHGSPLEIYCVLNLDNPLAKNYTAKDLIFTNSSQQINPNYITTINKTTAKLYIENVPMFNETFSCKLRLNESKSDKSLSHVNKSIVYPTSSESTSFVCSNVVMVGNKPQNVTDFHCVSYDWKNLTCTWHEPYNGINTNYSVAYSRGPKKDLNQCPLYEKQKCSWTLDTMPAYISTLEHMYFLLQGSNKFGNINQEIKIYNYAIIVPYAPQNLTAIDRTSSSIYLRWKIGEFSVFLKGLTYKVEYNRTSHSWPSWNVTIYQSKDIEKDGDYVKLNVSGLEYANMWYNFKVSMKSSVALEDSYWSPSAELVVKTKEAPPYKSPLTDIGGFEVFLINSTSCNIFVIWKPISNYEHNGDKFRYEITVFKEDQEINVKPVIITEWCAKLTNLPLGSYRFFIRSANLKGYAPISNFIYVPKMRDIVPKPLLFTQTNFGDGLYELSWKLPDYANHKITNFTIFSCQNHNKSSYECNNPVSWMHVPANTTKYNFTTNPSVDYRFAISVNTANSSSGMIWAMCVVRDNLVNKIKNVKKRGVNSTFIELKWDLDCSNRVKEIKGYNITYCSVFNENKMRCKDPQQTYLIPGDITTDHGGIPNLTPFTNYKITVAIFTDKFSGPPSEPLCIRTQEGAPVINENNIDVSNITSNSAVITWSKPNPSNGVIRHYEVSYNNKIIKTNDTVVELNGLSSFTYYTINITACTAVCASIEVHFATHIGPPGKVRIESPLVILNSSHIILKWKPPASLGGAESVSDYDIKLQYDEPTGPRIIYELRTTGNETILKLPSAPKTPNSSYSFYIRANVLDNLSYHQYGPWVLAYKIDYSQEVLNKAWKIWGIVLPISLCALLLCIFGYVGKKCFRRYLRMKAVEVHLPPQFISPEIKLHDIQDLAEHIDIKFSFPGDEKVECIITNISAGIHRGSINEINENVVTNIDTQVIQ